MLPKIISKRFVIIIAKALLVVIPPTIATFVLFKPFKQIPIPPFPNQTSFISQRDINKDLSTEVLSEFLQTNLNLNRYKLCFQNSGAMEYINIPPKLSLIKDQTPNLKTVFISFTQTNQDNTTSTINLSAAPRETNCAIIHSTINGISYNTGNITTPILGDYFIRLTKQEGDPSTTHMKITLSDGSNIEFNFHLTDIRIFIENDPISIVIQWYLLLILWGTQILLYTSLYNFITKWTR